MKTKDNDSINLEPLFLKVKELGIEQINIEGACFVSGKLILVNRGNKGYPHNHFIITDEKSGLMTAVFKFLLFLLKLKKTRLHSKAFLAYAMQKKVIN